MTSQRTVVVTVALLLGAAGGSGIIAATGGFAADPGGDAIAGQEDNETTTAAETVTTAVGEETTTAFVNLDSVDMTFDNQTSNGTVVNVTQAVLADGGFIAVYLARNVTGNFTTLVTAGNLGRRVGNTTYLGRGLHENVTIRLDRTLAKSQMLIAVAHRDTNGNQQFDPALDQAPTTEDGDETTTALAEQVDAAYTQDPGDRPVTATAFIRVEDAAAAGGATTAANETTTEMG